MTDIDQAARMLWDYMQMHQVLKKCDAIFLLGNRDDRTAEYAAELFNNGLGEWLIISGGHGRIAWDDADTEAEHFALIAATLGVPRERMLLEDRAANTGENIRFTSELLRQKELSVRSLLLVQKPYMERRTYATFKKQWPEPKIDIIATSPPIGYEHYFNDQNPKDQVINIMVGDLQRIVEYPKQGFQIPQEVPDKVMAAWRTLVAHGYNKRIMKAPHRTPPIGVSGEGAL